MRPFTRFALHSTLAAALVALAATDAAAAGYMKLGSIKGEAAVKDGKVGDGWIEIDSYQWGQTRGTQATGGVRVASGDVSGDSTATASGIPTGKRQHKPFTVTKELDKATPLLAKPLAKGSMTFRGTLQGCAVGMRYPTATVDMGYLRYEMENVLVSSCSTSGSGGGGGGSLPMEEISLNYEKISTIYTKQDMKEQAKPYRPKWDTPKPNKN